jgi:hypothetical protein
MHDGLQSKSKKYLCLKIFRAIFKENKMCLMHQESWYVSFISGESVYIYLDESFAFIPPPFFTFLSLLHKP